MEDAIGAIIVILGAIVFISVATILGSLIVVNVAKILAWIWGAA